MQLQPGWEEMGRASVQGNYECLPSILISGISFVDCC